MNMNSGQSRALAEEHLNTNYAYELYKVLK